MIFWGVHLKERTEDSRRAGIHFIRQTQTIQCWWGLSNDTLVFIHKCNETITDLWRDLIAVDEKVALSVETWLNGAATNMDSTCSTNVTVGILIDSLNCCLIQVLDISSIDLNGNTFKSSKDHSKWGVSNNSKKPLICVGDINRQESQTQRGGGALCIEDPKVINDDREDGIIDCRCGSRGTE